VSTALTPFPIKQSEFPMFKALSGGLAALALTAAPVAHAAAPARAAAPLESPSAMGGEGSFAPWVLAILIIAGIVLAIDATDDDASDSP
jgi:hypothetical protein